jgi:hypothetical protein
MNRVARDFISQEPRTFPFKIGRYLASGLSGFVTGVVVASIVWFIGVWYLGQVQSATSQGLTANQNSYAPTVLPNAAPPKTSTH